MQQIEDVFLKWQLALTEDDQDMVDYEEYDGSLQTVFVFRYGKIKAKQFMRLERMLQKEVDARILVSSIVME